VSDLDDYAGGILHWLRQRGRPLTVPPERDQFWADDRAGYALQVAAVRLLESLDLVEISSKFWDDEPALVVTLADETTSEAGVRFLRAALIADLDQVEAELRELERRYPGIGDDDEEPPAA
jgi:hypothetical protein